MSTSLSALTIATVLTPPVELEISPTEGLEGVDIQQFVSIRDMQKIVRAQSDRLSAGTSNQQYLIFRPVTKDDLAEIDHARKRIGKHTRMAHYTETNLLIIKLMPSVVHQGTHLTLAFRYFSRVIRMGLSEHDLCPVDVTTYHWSTSSKEADGYPTIVFESGLSESLRHLRQEARMWLTNSRGDVKIVVIISIMPAQTKLYIEKWELAPWTGHRPTTRAFSDNPGQNTPLVPTSTCEVTITPKTSLEGP